MKLFAKKVFGNGYYVNHGHPFCMFVSKMRRRILSIFFKARLEKENARADAELEKFFSEHPF